MGVPVWRITEAETPSVSAPAVAVVQPSGAAQTLSVTLDFTHPPVSFNLTSDGTSILSGNGPDLEYHTNWPENLPNEGVDLLLKASWSPGVSKTAVRVKVESDHVLADKTFWSDGSLTELVTVLPSTH